MKNSVRIVTRPIKDGLTGFGEQIIQAFKILEGKRAEVIITEWKAPRTDKQNRYYWGVVLKAYSQYFQQQGHFWSNDEMHLWIKQYVWWDYEDITVERVDKDGVVTYLPFRHILSSTTLGTKEWEERMEKSRMYAAQNFNGLQIEEPNEKIDEHVLEWLANPEGLYYGNDYKAYFNVVEPYQLNQ